MRRRLILLSAAALAAAAVPAVQAAQSPVDLPVLHPGVARGSYSYEPLEAVTPTVKIVDGDISDWTGESPGYGGTVVRSKGELIYSDHLFDAFGAATAKTAEQQRQLDELATEAPDLYRIDPVRQAPNEVDGNLPHSKENIGQGPRNDTADLLEVRLGADADDLFLLARTTTMLDPSAAAVVLLLDASAAEGDVPVGFGTGLTTTKADIAVLVTSDRVLLDDLRDDSDALSVGEVAANAVGYTNALEARIPRSALGGAANLALTAVSGARSGEGIAAPANVAFRTGEPPSTWFEKQQALALHDGTIDAFLTAANLGALAGGANERIVPGPGYHDRLFVSSAHISTESGQDGIFQHYGLYLPNARVENPAGEVPLTFWLHWRGGKAHSAATLSPRILRDNGEGRGGIVVSPRGRGTSEWYLGEGLVDHNEVFDDVRRSFAIAEDRVYVTGHSMGGWGSYLLSILYPDRFAAAFPVAGPVTQGAWTGADFEGCDDMTLDEYSPCYIQTNNSDPRTQHTRPLLENLRHVPIAVFQGGIDELVPTSGVTRQVERLVELGYRHRYYLFPTYEHYSHPVVDEWMEGVRYTNQFVRDPNPARVSYIRSMPFERTVESGPNQQDDKPGLTNFDFDRAYWMSGLTPADAANGVAHFEGRSLAIAKGDVLTAPEAGGPAAPGQAGPYAMTGLSWLTNPLARVATSNGFEIDVKGAKAVTLDGTRMGIDPTQPIVARIATDTPGTVVRLVFGSTVVEYIANPASL